MASSISGFNEIQASFKAMRDVVGGANPRSTVMTAALPALRKMQTDAPKGVIGHWTYKHRWVTPGFLSRNIRRKSFVSRDGKVASVIIGPISEAFYAQFFEFGTSKIPRRPFMVPSFTESKSEMGSRFGRRMQQLIDKAAKSRS